MIRPLDPVEIGSDLDSRGYAVVAGSVNKSQAVEIAGLFDESHWFRSTIDMGRHGYGDGSYRYFDHPVHPTIAEMRADLYSALLPTANRWRELLGQEGHYPTSHDKFLTQCHDAGQNRPTPLILNYSTGGHNRLHQDRYGEVAFPIQAAIMLSPNEDYGGGQFVLIEQRPRQQSRAHVIDLEQGDMVVFPNEHRPVKGTRGHFRVTFRHGVADVTDGNRRTLGLILHDAA